nr:hypothetical protein [Tanacetum cinerariifolium]
MDNCKKELEYNAVPPPYTSLFLPPKSDLSSTGLEELFNKPKTEKSKDKPNEVEPESVRKNSDAPIIEDWVPFNAVHPKRTMNAVNQESCFSKQAHSSVQRPNHKLTTLKNSYANKKVKTVWVKKVNTAKPKAAVNAAKEKAKYNVV